MKTSNPSPATSSDPASSPAPTPIPVPKFSAELINLPFRVSEEKIWVRSFEECVQAGFPSPAEDFQEVPLSLDEQYLQNPEATYLIKVAGHSMAPTLLPGDILIVKADIELSEGLIGIVSVNHTEFTVKRYHPTSQQLRADNPEFSPIKLDESDTLLCLGVVKQLIRNL